MERGSIRARRRFDPAPGAVGRHRYARSVADGERGTNEAERWFERYLCEHGYEHEYKPSFDGVSTHPDFLARRGGVEMVCEVKGFEEPPPLERRSASGQPVMLSDDEVYRPMRNAVREAARQLRPLAGSPYPLVVVLANPMGFFVDLNIDRLVEAMYGNPGWVGQFNPDEGRVENLRFEYGRDGRLRNDHPYISGVAILHERELAREHYDRWWANWKQTREPLENPSFDGIIAEAEAAQEAWHASEEAVNVPEGSVYLVEVLTTGSPEAVPVPSNVFDGPRDRRVERVPEQAAE